MYEAIAAGVETGEFIYDIADIKEFCEKEIAALDRKAAKAKERAATKAAEADALTGLVEAALSTDEFKPIADIAAIVAESDGDATVSKVTYRLSKLVKDGVAEKSEVTVPGKDGGKARKVMAYRACN
jgi:uncharacterized protein with PhoU and TrkA domain